MTSNYGAVDKKKVTGPKDNNKSCYTKLVFES